MTALIPILEHYVDGQRKPGVTSRALYAFLGLNPAVYARWTRKNIVKNPYAIEQLDWWEGFQPDVENPIPSGSGGRPTREYMLSCDFAKRLSMMARSAKGEEARQYFLDCEQLAQERPQLPKLHNPMNQVMIETVIRVDSLEYETAELKKENARLTADLVRVDTKADLVLETQNFFTIAEYATFNTLEHKIPPAVYKECSDHLRAYCQDNNIPFRKILVGGKPWKDEYGFHVSVFEKALPGWLKRRFAQTDLHVIPFPNA